MIYADDVQVYTSFSPSERESALQKIHDCIADIRSWSTRNKLVINDDKTELLHLSSKFLERLPGVELTVGDTAIEEKCEVRNLGVSIDNTLSRESQMNSTCRSAMAAIRKISPIRTVLDRGTTLRLIHAFVTSRLDACNALLGNAHAKTIAKLQRVQNIAARITERATTHTSTKLLLRNLHWLPVCKRVEYKILLLTYKALTGEAPSYISDLIHVYTPPRALRSQHQLLLQVLRFNTQYYGSSSFSVMAPTLWNTLPNSVRTAPTQETFKTKLKTY
ncbi:uncharacterized protein [Diadema antillarum]|uniref:uncharacterized protein n=1 Tax=Diadema antillarum TaxID=105358 RepID=UPI003A88792C